MSIPPLESHDRTIITVVVLILGGLLIYRYGDQVQVMVLVSSAWTLALTFWFRIKDTGTGL